MEEVLVLAGEVPSGGGTSGGSNTNPTIIDVCQASVDAGQITQTQTCSVPAM